MILYNEENKTFTLSTANSTYMLGIFNDSALLHLYWGKRLHNTDYITVPDKFEFRHLSALDIGNTSSDILPLEYSTYGNADMRIPALGISYADGSAITELRYKSFEIKDGKSTLEGLPAIYCEDGDKASTLTILLTDELKNIDVYLSYSIIENYDAIMRSVKIVNKGERAVLNSALSAIVDFHGIEKSEIITLDGAWCRERGINKTPITPGRKGIESRYGASSAMHNPFFAVCDEGADEVHGNVYGFSLIYSGSFTAGAELSPYNCARAYIGINPVNFNYVLEKGESFQTPETVMVYSGNGLGDMSRTYHRLYRKRLCRGKYRDCERFTIINNWEATYFNFNEEKIVEIAKKASELGIDTMVLDDGWFGKRNDDSSSLGDWKVNRDKLPNGLGGLVKRINGLGMRFGLWLEPEMVSPDSELYRAHPDWVLHCGERNRYLTRNQLTLDLSREDVCKFIIDSVSEILNSANIEYVKWDMNRYMSGVGSATLPRERQGEVTHRYILGLYRVFEALTNKFPNVLFESCASGGGRFDPGMLYYTPQIWVSDNTDAADRLKIQYGTSLVYPYSSMGAHVSACPNHQTGRTTPFEMRCMVALPGQFGFELDINKCSGEEIETCKRYIEKYEKLRGLFHNGDVYRLNTPESGVSTLQFVSEDKKEFVLLINSISSVANAPNEYIKLQGVNEEYIYETDGGEIYPGDYLMNKGIMFLNDSQYKSAMIYFKYCKGASK